MEVNPIKLNVKTKEDFDLNVNGTNVNQKGALTIVPDDGIYLGTGEKSESICNFYQINPNLLMNSDFSNLTRMSHYKNKTDFKEKDFICDRWGVSSIENCSIDYNFQTFKFMKKNCLRIVRNDKNLRNNIQISQFIEDKSWMNIFNSFTISGNVLVEKKYGINSAFYISVCLTTPDGVANFNNIYSETINIKTEGVCNFNVNLKAPEISRLYSKTHDNTLNNLNIFGLYFLIQFNDCDVTIHNLKMEVGKKATQWCPYGGSYEADRNACLRYYEKIGAYAPGIEESSNRIMFSIPFKIKKNKQPELSLVENKINLQVVGSDRYNIPISDLINSGTSVDGCFFSIKDDTGGCIQNRQTFEKMGKNFIGVDSELKFSSAND